MLFNSLEFTFFLPVVFVLYWFVTNKSLRLQNFLIFVASYVFYGWWDWRFLFLIAFSSLVDFFVGIQLSRVSDLKSRKYLLLISILVNLSFLGFFKYYNFFAESFSETFTLLGSSISIDRLNIILPVGISFYTFQTLSYSIDVYNKKLEPTKDIVAFLAFVSFFPQLVAGPIERASNLLPQFYKKRIFKYDHAAGGLRQALWGLFKKVVIADNCAKYANIIFNNYEDYNGSTLFLGGVFFAFQIYGDFSGYSDIAIGVSKLFGFNLKQNFSFPYFSRDIAEFWRRWHISLSTWFRDYLYIPLGGSRGGTWMKVRNTFIIFLVSGFWHGANFTFIAWGFINALYFLPLLLLNKNRVNTNVVAENRIVPSVKEIFQMLSTFILTVLAWVFFRSETIKKAVEIIKEIFSNSFFNIPTILEGINLFSYLIVLLLIVVFFSIEWFSRDKRHGLDLKNTKTVFRWLIYSFLIIIILLFGGTQQEFIYFQF